MRKLSASSIWAVVATLCVTTVAEAQSTQAELDAKRRAIEARARAQAPQAQGGASPSGEAVVGRPVAAFRGCDGPKNLGDSLADTAERVRLRQASRTDPTTARVFAARKIELNETPSTEALANDCRYRLDGIWTQDVEITLDASGDPSGFRGVSGHSAKAHLANGNYTTPVHMYVESLENGEALSVRPAADANPPFILRSADGIPLEEVLKPGGLRKAYLFPSQASPDENTSFFLDVTRSGRVRMRISGTNFYRPKPNVSQRADLSSVDAFIVGFNLDNLSANRRGYDIVEQDPFRLNTNGKSEIFAAADPKDYAIVEKRTIPLGLKLVPEGDQGTIAASGMISTQNEYQKTVATSFGVNIGFTKKNQDGQELGSASAGYSHSEENTYGMRSASKESIAMGFARHKLYALVMDQPFAKLSDAFVDAIDDARRYGRYDEVIEKFGTHYPYAVTYGSAAKMTATFSQQTVATWRAQGKNEHVNAGLAIGGFEVGASGGRYEASQQRSELLLEASSSEFDAVGGTGSYSEGGHSTGTPYPILADLRPLHELLNPMNFPNEPEIYGPIRGQLERAIETYLEAASR